MNPGLVRNDSVYPTAQRFHSETSKVERGLGPCGAPLPIAPGLVPGWTVGALYYARKQPAAYLDVPVSFAANLDVPISYAVSPDASEPPLTLLLPPHL